MQKQEYLLPYAEAVRDPVFLISLISTSALFCMMLLLKSCSLPDNPIEEYTEELIKEYTGVDVDFSPDGDERITWFDERDRPSL
jgi:hypothetical protein